MAKSAKKKSAATKKQTKKNVAPENKEKEIVETKAVKTKQSFDYWKASKIALPIILILIVLAFGWHVRTGSVTLDGLEDNVRANFYSNIQNLISQQVNEEYPNLNPAYKQEEVEKRFNQVLESGKINLGGEEIVIDDLVEQNIDQIKQSFKADNGQTYLTAIDPYFFMRKAENVLETGTPGDFVVNGVAHETKSLAPKVTEIKKGPELHVWLEAKLMALNGINEDSTDGEKTASIFTLSAILAILASIPLFFILRKYSNDLFAFFGALLLTSVGTFVSRTVAGFVDTDAYVVLFPLLIILFVVFSIFTENKRLSVVYAIIAGLFQGMFLWA
ncbi:MAG: STT3 domain-containing protein, partial [Nanoarchaeota archaeon]